MYPENIITHRSSPKKRGTLCILSALLCLLSSPLIADTNQLDSATNSTVEASEELPNGRAAARHAQKLYSGEQYTEAAEAYLRAGIEGTPDALRTYRYNAAIAFLRAEQYKRATETFRLLINDDSAPDDVHTGLGLALARSAAGLREQGDIPGTLGHLIDGADALREALRHIPGENQRRNLAALLAQLPELREEARIQRLIKAHGEKQPQELINTMLKEQRAILEQANSAFTNNSPSQITQLEALSQRQRNNADLWVPLARNLMQQLAQSVTNQNELAEIQGLIEATDKRMTKAIDSLRDIDPVALDDLIRSEAGAYKLWRGMADPRAIITEDLRRQSNAINRVSSPIIPPPESEQSEAGTLSYQFQQTFPQWVEAMQQQALADTNAVFNLTQDDRAEIERLTNETLANQQLALENIKKGPPYDSIGPGRKAYESLDKIRELLPDPPQQKNENKNENEQQNEDENENEDENDQQDSEQEPEIDPDKEDDQQEKEEPPPEPKDQTSEGVKELLRRALEREKEHAEDKRKHKMTLPSLPSERDW